MHIREKEPIADAVERESQRRKSISGQQQDRAEPACTRHVVLRCQSEATLSHLLEVVQVWSPTPPATALNRVRKEPAHPQGVIAQVCACQKSTLRRVVVDLVGNRRQRVIRRVVMRAELLGALPQAELQNDRRDVVGQYAIVFASGPHGLTHDHVAEEWQ